MIKFKNIVLGFIIAIVFSSCAIDSGMDSSVVKQILSITLFDAKGDYTVYRTFDISDSIGMLNGEGKVVTKPLNDQQKKIRDEVVSSMQTYGYTLVAANEKPDLAITLSGVEQTILNYSYPYWGFYDPYYWGGYWGGYYGGGWGYYYPSYPVVTSSYSIGGILIEMVDFKNPMTEEQQLKVVWTGILRGILGINFTNSEIIEAVRDCFNQTDAAPFNTNEI